MKTKSTPVRVQGGGMVAKENGQITLMKVSLYTQYSFLPTVSPSMIFKSTQVKYKIFVMKKKYNKGRAPHKVILKKCVPFQN